MPDVDIDFYDRQGVLDLFKHTPATIVKNDTHERHKTGIYFHDIPVNPNTKGSSIDYKKAEGRGYFKIDVLNVNIYKDIKSELFSNLSDPQNIASSYTPLPLDNNK